MTYEPNAPNWEIDPELELAIKRRRKPTPPTRTPRLVHQPQDSPPMAIAAVVILAGTAFLGVASLLKVAGEWNQYSLNKADIEERALQQGYQNAISDLCGGAKQ